MGGGEGGQWGEEGISGWREGVSGGGRRGQ